MNVKELKEYLNQFDDETPVMIMIGVDQQAFDLEKNDIELVSNILIIEF